MYTRPEVPMDVPAQLLSHFSIELGSSPVGLMPSSVVSEIVGFARLRFPHMTVQMPVGLSGRFLHPLFNSCHPTTPFTSRTLALHCRKEFLKLGERESGQGGEIAEVLFQEVLAFRLEGWGQGVTGVLVVDMPEGREKKGDLLKQLLPP
jgi:hypothetical protein